MIEKHLGKIALVPIVLAIVLLGYFGVNVSYNQFLVDCLSTLDLPFYVQTVALYINLFCWLGISIGFLLFTRFQYSNRKNLFHLLYMVCIWAIQFFMISFLWDWNENARSFEYDSNEGVVAIVIIPVVLVFLILFSVVFDVLKNKNVRTKQ